MGTVHTEGAILHYSRTGGNLPPLLLLHGLTGSGSCWRILAKTLQSRFDVIMPDARGHGQSSAPRHGYSYSHHAADTIELVDSLGLTAPFIAGHSMGGMTAALVARALNPAPRGLILLEPPFLTPKQQQEVRNGRAQKEHETLLQLPMENILADARTRHPHRTEEMIECVSTARAATCPEAFQVLDDEIPDYSTIMGDIASPVLLVLGEESPVLLSSTIENLRKCTRNIEITYIPNAGHGIHYDAPDLAAAAIQSFLMPLLTA